MDKCTLTPNIYMALHSLISEYKTPNARSYALRILISRVCGYSNCYCKKCNEISEEFYDINHYENIDQKQSN